jgi:hypothetical protein
MSDTPQEVKVRTPTCEPDMLLPQGKSCADCHWFRRCVALIGPKYINAQATSCDWSPSRFRQAALSALREVVRS